ncbi:neuronal acetylcholine receptor subunit alpha-3-like [Crassostrea virginica]
METAYLCVFFVCLLRVAHMYNLTDEADLHAALFSGYNTELRPGNNRDYPLNVSVVFHLFAIKEFVEVTSKFSVNGVFQMSWKDERLSWNPSMYGNCSYTLISQNKIWLPNIVTSNPFKESYGLGSDLVKVYLSSDGTCNWVTMHSFDVICDADVTYYPFDKQYCALKFAPYSIGSSWMNITFPSSKLTLSSYEENGLWEIEDSTAFSTDLSGTVEVILGLYLRRRPTYYIASLLLPMTFVAVLQSFVLLIPNESGERIGYSVTMLLASVVFLTLVQEKLPESSEPNISILGYLLLGYISLGALLTLVVILSSNLLIQTKPVPKWLQSVFCMRQTKVHNIAAARDTSPKEPDLKEDDSEIDWKEISKKFDRFCFVTFQILYAVQLIVYFSLVLGKTS